MFIQYKKNMVDLMKNFDYFFLFVSFFVFVFNNFKIIVLALRSLVNIYFSCPKLNIITAKTKIIFEVLKYIRFVF